MPSQHGGGTTVGPRGFHSTAAELLILEELHDLMRGRIQPPPPPHAPQPDVRPRRCPSKGRPPPSPRQSVAPRNADRGSRRKDTMTCPTSSQEVDVQQGGSSAPVTRWRDADVPESVAATHGTRALRRPQSAPGRRGSRVNSAPAASAGRSMGRESAHNIGRAAVAAAAAPKAGSPPTSPKRRYLSPRRTARESKLGFKGMTIGGLNAQTAPWFFSMPLPLDDPRRYRSAEAQAVGLNFFDGMTKLLDFYSGKVATDTFMRAEASKSIEPEAGEVRPRLPPGKKPEKAAPRPGGIAKICIDRMGNQTSSAKQLQLASSKDGAEERDTGMRPWLDQRLRIGMWLQDMEDLRDALGSSDVQRLDAAVKKAEEERLDQFQPEGFRLLADARRRCDELWEIHSGLRPQSKNEPPESEPVEVEAGIAPQLLERRKSVRITVTPP